MAVRTQARHEPSLCFDTVEVQFDGPVLLIEDEESVRRAAIASLEALGVTDVITASDGDSGLQLLDECRPAVVLVDLMMPGVDGFGVLRGLRHRPRRLRPGKIIILSGVDDPAVEKGIHQLGADRILAKPYHLADLYEALTN